VIAAQHALHTGRATKVFILDWDIHHGNGIQDLTYDDPNIFYLSIHRASSTKQWFYPDTGRPEETGGASGIGTNANIALKRGGMGNKEYAAAFCELVLPAMEDFQPDLILIACGADAAKGDLLGDFGLTSDMYYVMTKSLLLTAGFDVPFIAILEGGYNLPVIADCMQAVAIALLNEPFEGTFISSQSPHMNATQSPQERAQPKDTTNGIENDGSWPLSRFWNPAEKAELQAVRTTHPEKGVTKQALVAIKRTAHALAASQSRYSQYYFQNSSPPSSPVGIERGSDSSMVPSVRRMRLLDYDRCPAKHCRRKRA
jgi:Histone deacetylase domain